MLVMNILPQTFPFITSLIIPWYNQSLHLKIHFFLLCHLKQFMKLLIWTLMGIQTSDSFRSIRPDPMFLITIWTYVTLAKQFIRDSSLEVITSPTFHPKDKTITSSWRDGCCNYGKSTYKYLHEKLTLIEEETAVDMKNPSIQINTLEKLVDGKMKLISKTTEKIKH